MYICKVGPLLVISGVITSISRVITPVTQLFSAIYRGEIIPFITIGSGPTLCDVFNGFPGERQQQFQRVDQGGHLCGPRKTVAWCKVSKVQGGEGIWVFPKLGGKPQKWMVYKGKPY